jgi:FkbM family methyltransferase
MPGLVEMVRKALKFGRGSHAELVAEMRRINEEDRRRLAFYRQFVTPNDLVFDVGANLGNRTKLFLELGAKVVAVEPQDHCAELLEQAFGGRGEFTLLRKALGAGEGKSTMFVSEAHAVSTLSQDWVRATTSTGRFGGVRWNGRQQVSVTTLDRIVQEYGTPAFIKIDVEGFEYEVLKGLSQPPRAASIEFATESLPIVFKAMEHVCGLAPMEFQVALGEDLAFVDTHWMARAEAEAELRQICGRDTLAWGDVYMRVAG